MEQVRNEHYLAFCKHLPICDIGLGTKVLYEIQPHYDNNPKLEILIKKLQMLVYFIVNKEQKAYWLR